MNTREGIAAETPSPLPLTIEALVPARKDHSFAVYEQLDLSTTLLVEPDAVILLPPTAVRLFYWLRPGPKP